MPGRTTKPEYLARRRFGRLKVVEETALRAGNGAVVWRCVCTLCHVEVLVATHNLTSGNTEGCGCVQRERSRKANKKGGVRWRKPESSG